MAYASSLKGEIFVELRVQIPSGACRCGGRAYAAVSDTVYCWFKSNHLYHTEVAERYMRLTKDQCRIRFIVGSNPIFGIISTHGGIGIHNKLKPYI